MRFGCVGLWQGRCVPPMSRRFACGWPFRGKPARWKHRLPAPVRILGGRVLTKQAPGMRIPRGHFLSLPLEGKAFPAAVLLSATPIQAHKITETAPRPDGSGRGFCGFLPKKFGYFRHLDRAASTTCSTRTEVVTLPTPPGTGVMAATTGSASAKFTSPHSLPSALTLMPTSMTT